MTKPTQQVPGSARREYRLLEAAKARIEGAGGIEALLDRITKGEANPFTLAEQLAEQIVK